MFCVVTFTGRFMLILRERNSFSEFQYLFWMMMVTLIGLLRLVHIFVTHQNKTIMVRFQNVRVSRNIFGKKVFDCA